MEDFEKAVRPVGFFPNLWLILWRVLIAVVVPAVSFFVMYVGFRFLRESAAPAAMIAVVAVIWGVGGVALLYFATNWVITQLGPAWRRRLQPFLFVGPAMVSVNTNRRCFQIILVLHITWWKLQTHVLHLPKISKLKSQI